MFIKCLAELNTSDNNDSGGTSIDFFWGGRQEKIIGGKVKKMRTKHAKMLVLPFLC